MARGQHANHVLVAIARALVGVMGAIATQVPVTPSRADAYGTHHGEGGQRAWEAPQPRLGSPSPAFRDQEASACRERARHPTDASQVEPTHGSPQDHPAPLLAPALPAHNGIRAKAPVKTSPATPCPRKPYQRRGSIVHMRLDRK
jgi:hypothetical protein